MTNNLTLTGMILKVMPVGEYDKRIVILTRERGKITAFVRGARRQKSSMQAASNLFCFGTFEAYEGKSAYTVVKADIQNYFRELTLDYDMTCYGCYFLELADFFSAENDDGRNQLNLLYVTMKALLKQQVDRKLIRRIYELRTLVFNGTYPNFFSCTVCGKKEGLTGYDAHRHGLICSSCRKKATLALSEAAVYTLQFITASPLQKLYSFQLKEEVYTEVKRVVDGLLHTYLDRTLNSLLFLPDQE